jgi:hypothetical protein
MECGARTPEDSKISLPPVIQTMAGNFLTAHRISDEQQSLYWQWIRLWCSWLSYDAVITIRQERSRPLFSVLTTGISLVRILLTHSPKYFVANPMIALWNRQATAAPLQSSYGPHYYVVADYCHKARWQWLSCPRWQLDSILSWGRWIQSTPSSCQHPDHIAANDRVTGELERKWKEAVVI